MWLLYYPSFKQRTIEVDVEMFYDNSNSFMYKDVITLPSDIKQDYTQDGVENLFFSHFIRTDLDLRASCLVMVFVIGIKICDELVK